MKNINNVKVNMFLFVLLTIEIVNIYYLMFKISTILMIKVVYNVKWNVRI